MRRPRLRSVALINPLGDYGIDTYTYELGEGLAANGVSVDAYCSVVSRIGSFELSPQHRRFNVLGARLPARLAPYVPPPAGAQPKLEDTKTLAPPVLPRLVPWRQSIRAAYLSYELAFHLKNRGYDAIWTQWPEMDDYSSFWKAVRLLKLPLIHTVHNVLPHERFAGDTAVYGEVYDSSRVLFVHSQPVRDELAAEFPGQICKTVVVPLGAYTFYKRRPQARERVRASLDLPPNSVVLLFCGAIRPYKNIDAVIAALAASKRDDVFLVIAGSEAADPPADPLLRTKQLLRESNIDARVRLLPGFLDTDAMSELFEASDVLLLPYLKSYGSGLLMLGITFGKYIVATRSGMEESASRYSRAIILDGDDAATVGAGIEIAADRVRQDSSSLNEVLPEFQWPNIAAKSLSEISRILSTS